MVGGVWFNMAVQAYIHVKTVAEALQYLSDPDKSSQIIAGGVGIADQLHNGFLNDDQLIDISRIAELKLVEKIDVHGEPYLKIGSVLNLNSVANLDEVKDEFPVLAKALKESSDPARKNAFTFGGRITTKIPQGMLFPALCALNTLIVIKTIQSERMIPILEWLKSEPMEIPFLITSVLIPYTLKPSWVMQDVKRRNFPGEIIAGVLIAANKEETGFAENLRIFGSVDNFGLVTFELVENYLNGKKITKELLRQTEEVISSQLKNNWGLDEDAQYRRRVLTALITRSLEHVFLAVEKEQE
ncbi:MAG: hypothetical protein CVU39_11165 [Chloroflexi bacterium HGW-Chloroflexi-10]|nr:MAG: hypothetical protein CVU39_11165 [Chloroflexi bacterium HGW-Chloroflexi-10]